MGLQHVQNSLCDAVFISGIKRQINGLLLRIAHKPCVIGSQLLRGGIADRRLPLSLETESPGACFDGSLCCGRLIPHNCRSNCRYQQNRQNPGDKPAGVNDQNHIASLPLQYMDGPNPI